MSNSKSLQLILQEGEGYKIEFKQKVANLDREIVAFANAAGGSIFIGVDDDGKQVGLSITNKLKSQVIDIAHNCDPSIQVNLVCHHDILEVQVAEGDDKPYRCKDGFFLRIGPSSQKLRRDEIITLITNSTKIHFDEAINKRFIYPDDFSEPALKSFMQSCGIQTKLPATDVLQSLNLATEQEQNFRLNNTGILFFAKDPQYFFPESYITAVRYKTNDRFSIIDKQDCKGNLVEQIEQTLAFAKRNIAVKIHVSGQGVHEDIYEYPLVALREAIVNAVVHRDYGYDGSHIYLHMYPDRIDIENPGGLYRGLSIENLGTRSVRRNRLIADILHRLGYIERVGSGFDRMRQSLVENDNPPLQVSVTNFFNIRFYKRLETPTLKQLTARQQTLYRLIQEKNTIAKSQAAMALGVSDDTALRELNALLEAGLITKTGLGKATSYQIIE